MSARAHAAEGDDNTRADTYHRLVLDVGAVLYERVLSMCF